MKPVILAIGGHDPSGGAGIQADIETIGANGGQAITVPTAITLQDSHHVQGFEPVATALLQQQLDLLLSDFPVSAIKIGMVGTMEICTTIGSLLLQHPTIPVILDPVLAGGGGGALSAEALAETITTELIPHTRLATPNRDELERLGGSDRLFELGCQNLLITGTDRPATEEAADQVHHQLLQANGSNHTLSGDRLPHSYHGSGCTLAAAIATQIAHGAALQNAVETGLSFTHNSLLQATHPTDGQHLPNRFFKYS